MHVIEIDRTLEPPLRDALERFPNATLHFADAMTLDLAALAPAPDKLIANLPYGVAAGALIRSIEELPGLRRWVSMVQREVGERLRQCLHELSPAAHEAAAGAQLAGHVGAQARATAARPPHRRSRRRALRRPGSA